LNPNGMNSVVAMFSSWMMSSVDAMFSVWMMSSVE